MLAYSSQVYRFSVHEQNLGSSSLLSRQFISPSHIFVLFANFKYAPQSHVSGSSDQSSQSFILSQNADFFTHFPFWHCNSDGKQPTKIIVMEMLRDSKN